MTKIETKSVSVLPNEEQKVIDFYEKFGWLVQSSQEIFNKDTKDEVRTNLMGDDELWNVTTTTNYVKIIFQRDKGMKNYEEINNLQKEYETNEKIFRNAPGLMPGKILLIVIGFFLLAMFGNFIGGEILNGIIFLFIGGGIFALRFFFYYKPRDEKAIKAYGDNKNIEQKLEKLM